MNRYVKFIWKYYKRYFSLSIAKLESRIAKHAKHEAMTFALHGIVPPNLGVSQYQQTHDRTYKVMQARVVSLLLPVTHVS